MHSGRPLHPHQAPLAEVGAHSLRLLAPDHNSTALDRQHPAPHPLPINDYNAPGQIGLGDWAR